MVLEVVGEEEAGVPVSSLSFSCHDFRVSLRTCPGRHADRLRTEHSLVVIRVAGEQARGAVQLLEQDQARESMGQGQA